MTTNERWTISQISPESKALALIYPMWSPDAKAHHYEYRVGPNDRKTRIQLVPFDCERDVFVSEEGHAKLTEYLIDSSHLC